MKRFSIACTLLAALAWGGGSASADTIQDFHITSITLHNRSVAAKVFGRVVGWVPVWDNALQSFVQAYKFIGLTKADDPKGTYKGLTAEECQRVLSLLVSVPRNDAGSPFVGPTICFNDLFHLMDLIGVNYDFTASSYLTVSK